MTISLILAKSDSKRLKNKNSLAFKGKPMFLWNVEKCVKLFDKTYVSSNSKKILKLAKQAGAIPIKRPKELCGDTPNIPVYRHAINRMKEKPKAIVAVQANSPTIERSIISTVKNLIGKRNNHKEIMTCHQDRSIYGSVWAMKIGRLREYKDFYNPEPDILVIDESIDIHNKKDFKDAGEQYDRCINNNN